jgi:hypothetical protein
MVSIYHQDGLPFCFIPWNPARDIVREMLSHYDHDLTHKIRLLSTLGLKLTGKPNVFE